MKNSVSGLPLVFTLCFTAILCLCDASDQPEVAVPVAVSGITAAGPDDKRQSSFARILRSPSSFSRILRSPSSFSRILRSGEAEDAQEVAAAATSGSDEDMPRYLRDMSFTRILRRSPSSFSRILRSPSSFSRILRSRPSSFSRILRGNPSSFSRILKRSSSSPSSFSRILRSPYHDEQYLDMYGEPTPMEVYWYDADPEVEGAEDGEEGLRGKRASSSFSRILRANDYPRIPRASSFSRIL